MPFPIELRRQLIPNGCRRAPWHDYRARCIYMITINAAPGVPPFSTLVSSASPRPVLSPLGEIIHKAISRLAETFPFVSILRRVVMPEHIHFVIFVKEQTEVHLGLMIRALKKEIRIGYAALRGVELDRMPTLFESGYHDRILSKKNQLSRMLAYVSDNPRRRLIRMENRDFFCRFPLIASDGTRYEGYGNPGLLAEPDIEAVKVSSKYAPEYLRKRKLDWLHTVLNGGVLVSPFISPAEKKVRDWATENGGRLIFLEDNGFGPRFAPKGTAHTLCAEGRLLLIAPIEHNTSTVYRGKAYWESLNALAVRISQGHLQLLTEKLN